MAALKPRPLRILFLEPFYGGSHRDVADGLAAHSRHNIDLVTLPDRFWKWRLRGAALYLADRIRSPQCYDGLIVSSLMSLADLKAVWGPLCPPAMVYFHENQFNYPLSPGESMDYQYGFTNISTALVADRILFNSDYQLQAFLDALPGFIDMMPDCRPNWVKKAIEAKARVARPGCHFASGLQSVEKNLHPPLIIWNHRWEHDKNPEDFFKALGEMQKRSIGFEVALLGEGYDRKPKVFEEARDWLGDRIVQYGSVPAKQEYYRWLGRGAIVVSTARQENFGIAVVEAMAHGCLPILPNRLAYPEILPGPFHAAFLYNHQNELEDKLAELLSRPDGFETERRNLTAAMKCYAWTNAVENFDRELDRLGMLIPRDEVQR